MGGRRSDTRWDNEIFKLTRENPKRGPGTVLRALEELAAQKGIGPEQLPSERTVARKQAWFREQGPDYQRQFALVQWPETFESGDLPWEAAPLALRLLRRRWPKRVPVRQVLWVWRVLQSGGDLHKAGTIGTVLAVTLPGTPSAADVRRKAERLLLGVPAPDGEDNDLFFIAESDLDTSLVDFIEDAFAPGQEGKS